MIFGYFNRDLPQVSLSLTFSFSGEVAVYWLEHFFLLLIPILLLKTLTVPQYTAKEMTAWAMMAYGVWGLFHFWFLLPIALWTQANLNSVLCPAITDPFRLIEFDYVIYLNTETYIKLGYRE